MDTEPTYCHVFHLQWQTFAVEPKHQKADSSEHIYPTAYHQSDWNRTHLDQTSSFLRFFSPASKRFKRVLASGKLRPSMHMGFIMSCYTSYVQNSTYNRIHNIWYNVSYTILLFTTSCSFYFCFQLWVRETEVHAQRVDRRFVWCMYVINEVTNGYDVKSSDKRIQSTFLQGYMYICNALVCVANFY